MELDYRIERVGPSSYAHLVSLTRLCFGTRTTLELVRRKFNTASFGAKDIGYIAFAPDGSPAAYYGVFPVLVRVDGGVHLAAQSGDTMTAPQHQKKGLFIRLASMTYELARASGVQFIFGFPNENSLPGFERKLGWRFTGHLFNFELISSALPLGEIASKADWVGSLYARFADRKAGSLVMRVAADQFAPVSSGILRDERFATYKTGLGARWITIDGIDLLVKPSVHLYVGDINCGEGTEATELRRSLLHAGKHFLCRRVIATFSEKHPLFQLAASITPPVQGLPIGFLDLGSGLPISDLAFSRADLDTF